jgi:hypothetical protein
LINAMVTKLGQEDPIGTSEHGMIKDSFEGLQAMAFEQVPIMIIDDFADLRQTMLQVGINARIRVYRAAVLNNKPASMQPILDAITERQQTVLPKDASIVKDATAAREVANDLAKRVQNRTAEKIDFGVLIEAITGQRLFQFVNVTMARRMAAGRVAAVDFKLTRALITARSTAERQLYRDAGTEATRLTSITADLQQRAQQAGTNAVPFRRHAAHGNDLNLRRMMKYLEQKGLKGQQTTANFNRLRGLLAIRAAGPLGNSASDRKITENITAEVGRLEQLGINRGLVKEDFKTLERLRVALMISATEASLKK